MSAPKAPAKPHSPRFDNAIYAARRARFAQGMGANAVAVIPTAPEQRRNRDSDFLYRPDSYLEYLTGFREPNACLVVATDSTGHVQSHLFCAPKDETREIWDGYRTGPAAAPQVLGVDSAADATALDAALPKWLENRDAVFIPLATHDGLAAKIEAHLTQVRSRIRYGVGCPSRVEDACRLLDEMRLVKGAEEIAVMRRAAQISAWAHIRAMQTSAQLLRRGEPVYEYTLDAELLHEFRRHGSEYPAYGSIVAAGANACVLHYRADRAPVRDGDLVLIDAGCELHGYASDITRTFPANGRFTPQQRAVYDVVLAAQEAATAATRPGSRFTDAHEAAVAVIAQGLLDLKLLDANKLGSVQDVIEQKAYFRYYMHRTGHWLGLDVHDCGDYTEPSEIGQTSSRVDVLSGETITNRPSRILREGMVTTIEPGIYIRPAPDVPQGFENIGIRIEDDAVVTATGCKLITRDVPVRADEIEALMRG